MKDDIFIKYENEKKFQYSLNSLDEGFEDDFVKLLMMQFIADLAQLVAQKDLIKRLEDMKNNYNIP